jgi:DNA repair protein RecO (recombination protein O)
MKRVDHAAAFVLHQQAWGDHGRIFELFTREHGRMSVFAHGVRGSKARLSAVLQPFVPLLISWAGRGDAPRLIGAEVDSTARLTNPLPPERVMSAYYLSELLLALTIRHDPQPELFECYASALAGLRSAPSQERELRCFEKRLLEVIGYGLAGVDDAAFDDAAEVERLRPILRDALAQCLEGRSLKTRIVAKSLRQLERSQPTAERG